MSPRNDSSRTTHHPKERRLRARHSALFSAVRFSQAHCGAAGGRNYHAWKLTTYDLSTQWPHTIGQRIVRLDTLPHRSGRDTADRNELRTIRPKTGIVRVTSGDTDEIADGANAGNTVIVVQNPFDVDVDDR